MRSATRILELVKVLPRLGVSNVARVVIYRVRLAAGWRPKPIERACPSGPVFSQAGSSVQAPSEVEQLLFGRHPVRIQSVPDWHANPFDSQQRIDPEVEWTDALASLKGCDVKPYWELSRFYWVPQFALAARDGDGEALNRLEVWLRNWIEANPPHRGINWACGQEAAIRLMNLSLAAVIMDGWERPSPALAWLVEAHARRIEPTLTYALGQDNNHGSAEACALYLAGTWGARWSMPGADALARRGHYWLGNRVLRLIQKDGSPSQYSTTYHRSNLETFSLAELWARRTGAKALNPLQRGRVTEGARWLHRITDEATGDAPNLGANDGSHLFNLTGATYRDFRPSVELVANLFDDSSVREKYDPRLAALGLAMGSRHWPAPSSATSDEGGFHALHRNRAFALLRYPRFRFRPGQADALHLDLWIDGQNVLRDAGTFDYVSPEGLWFSSTAAHNTVEFDRRDQMPQLGRFLFGAWLRAERVRPVTETSGTIEAAASYTDAWGARHHRHVTLTDGRLICVDELDGNGGAAVLRWRLAPGIWHVSDRDVRCDVIGLRISADTPFSMRLTAGAESRHYRERTEVPVLEVETQIPAKITTEVIF